MKRKLGYSKCHCLTLDSKEEGLSVTGMGRACSFSVTARIIHVSREASGGRYLLCEISSLCLVGCLLWAILEDQIPTHKGLFFSLVVDTR